MQTIHTGFSLGPALFPFWLLELFSTILLTRLCIVTASRQAHSCVFCFHEVETWKSPWADSHGKSPIIEGNSCGGGVGGTKRKQITDCLETPRKKILSLLPEAHYGFSKLSCCDSWRRFSLVEAQSPSLVQLSSGICVLSCGWGRVRLPGVPSPHPLHPIKKRFIMSNLGGDLQGVQYC